MQSWNWINYSLTKQTLINAFSVCDDDNNDEDGGNDDGADADADGEDDDVNNSNIEIIITIKCYVLTMFIAKIHKCLNSEIMTVKTYNSIEIMLNYHNCWWL